METVITLLAILMALIGAAGWIWITIAAFSNDEMVWGILCIFLCPACVIYGFMNMGELKVPLMMVLGGIVGRILVVLLAIMAG